MSLLEVFLCASLLTEIPLSLEHVRPVLAYCYYQAYLYCLNPIVRSWWGKPQIHYLEFRHRYHFFYLYCFISMIWVCYCFSNSLWFLLDSWRLICLPCWDFLRDPGGMVLWWEASIMVFLLQSLLAFDSQIQFYHVRQLTTFHLSLCGRQMNLNCALLPTQLA